MAQLRLINLNRKQLRIAIHDHNRAFAQRSRWQREQLLGINELANYDLELTEEWERLSTPIGAEYDDEISSAEQKLAYGQETYGKLRDHALPQIRPGVNARYIPVGSLHMLADDLKVGWHPDWREVLSSERHNNQSG